MLWGPDFQVILLAHLTGKKGYTSQTTKYITTQSHIEAQYFFMGSTEQYSSVEKQHLVIKLGIQAFQVYLLGRPFTAQMDHYAPVWLNHLKENNVHLTRCCLSLELYCFEVIHDRDNSTNGNADILSLSATNQFPADEWGRGPCLLCVFHIAFMLIVVKFVAFLHCNLADACSYLQDPTAEV